MIIYQAEDNTETEFPEATEWSASVAVRAGTNEVGFGFFLWDSDGKPIGSCCMTPAQAMAQGLYLIENAYRMVSVREELQRPERIAQVLMERLTRDA